MLTNQQIDKLSDLFLDLAKGLLLASFVVPGLTKGDFLIFLKGFIGGVVCTYFSLMLLSMKGDKNE